MKDEEKNVSQEWKTFYLFINDSYKVSRFERYSVSQLASALKKEGLLPSPYIKLYAHGLYTLALHNDLEIYNEGFNI